MRILFSIMILNLPIILLILFSFEIQYFPNNFDITSVKNLFLPVPCSPIMINAVSVLQPEFCIRDDIHGII
jgi:hypothetical protein